MVHDKIRTYYCEVCGDWGNSVSIEGWNTCRPHHQAPKPDKPVFHYKDGHRLLPTEPDPNDRRVQVRGLDEALYPIDELDFEAP